MDLWFFRKVFKKFWNFFSKIFTFTKKLSHKNAIKTDWPFWPFFSETLAIFDLRELATLKNVQNRSFLSSEERDGSVHV